MMVVFVDVDDTLLRFAGSKKIPIPGTITKVQELWAAGVHLYCWSMGGADYARNMATDLGIAHLFKGFLPKPHAIIDDQAFAAQHFTPWDLNDLVPEKDPAE